MVLVLLPDERYPEFNAARQQVLDRIAVVYPGWAERARGIPVYIDTDATSMINGRGPYARNVGDNNRNNDSIILPISMTRPESITHMGGRVETIPAMSRENISVALAHEYGHFFIENIRLPAVPFTDRDDLLRQRQRMKEANADFFSAQIMGAPAFLREVQYLDNHPGISLSSFGGDHPSSDERVAMAQALVRDPGLLRHSIASLEIRPDATIIDRQHPGGHGLPTGGETRRDDGGLRGRQ